MSIDSLITRMRSREAALANTTVTLTRYAARGAFNPATASYAAPTSTTIYTGAAMVLPGGDQVVKAGETGVELCDFVVKFPADTDVQLGDIVTVTVSARDAGLVGQGMRVVDVDNSEWQVCRRAKCIVETPRPAA